MIDASRSPRPAWKRYATFVALAALIVVAAFVIWNKELHHTASSATPPRSPVVAAPAPTAKVVTPTPTTVPGGLPISSRDLFSG
jgi:hypothetical protein